MLALTGCGMGPVAPSGPVSGTLSLRGVVHGGQPPVAFSTITLYAASTSGYAGASSSLLTLPVTTDAGGNFNITGDYTCAHANDQLYIVAHSGNPGLPLGTNSKLTLVALLGNCSAAPSIPYIFMNEVTTVAAAWVLAPFAGTDYTHVGTSSTNLQGLANAFTLGRQLVDITTGTPATLPAGIASEPAKIYSLANSLAPCVNSDGTTPCTLLFNAVTPAGGTLPQDTWSAALSVVRNPGNNVGGVYNLANTQSPFVGLPQAPHEWTLTQTLTGNGLSMPTWLATDSAGNVFVANFNSPLSVFAPSGTSLGNFNAGSNKETYGLAIDENDLVWLTNSEYRPSGSQLGSILVVAGAQRSEGLGKVFGYGYSSGTDFPVAIAADGKGAMYMANNGDSTATIWHDTDTSTYTFPTAANGNSNTANLAYNETSFPVAIVPDGNGTSTFPGSFWLANYGDTTISHLDAMGNLLLRPNCCKDANGITLDTAGSVWVSNYYNDTLVTVTPGGTVTTYGGDTCTSPCNGGVYYPGAIATDGAQDLWIANFRGTSISHFAGINHTDAYGNAVPAGTPLSPDNVFQGNGNIMTAGGFGLDANLSLPFSAAIDQSGTVWISNEGNSQITMFVGLGAPTNGPRYASVARP